MYRDDRDAQLARLDALDRENRELRAENGELRRTLTEPAPKHSRERDYQPAIDGYTKTLAPPPSATCFVDRSRDRYLEDPNIRLGVLLTLMPIALGILVVLLAFGERIQ